MTQEKKRRFDPGQVGMRISPHCNGNGTCSEGPNGRDVCKKCGGFALVRKEQEKRE
jgi:DnaJ-class molecular chaperone